MYKTLIMKVLRIAIRVGAFCYHDDKSLKAHQVQKIFKLTTSKKHENLLVIYIIKHYFSVILFIIIL